MAGGRSDPAGWPLLWADGGLCVVTINYPKRKLVIVVKLRQGSGKDWQEMALKVKGLKA